MINIPQEVKKHIEEPRKSDSLHPSACTSESCLRQEIYRLRGYSVTNPRPPSEQWTLASYSTYEDYIADSLADNHPAVLRQYPLRHGKWSGKLDAYIDGAERIGVEVKSVNPFGFKWGSLPYKHHADQATVYIILAQILCIPLDEMLLVYIERWQERKGYGFPNEQLPEIHPSLYQYMMTEPAKGVPVILQVPVEPTNKDLLRVSRMMDEMVLWANRDDLPARPYQHYLEHKWNCAVVNKKEGTEEIRCPYFDTCWQGVVEAPLPF